MKPERAGRWEKGLGMNEGKSEMRYLGQGKHLGNFAKESKISQKYSSG